MQPAQNITPQSTPVRRHEDAVTFIQNASGRVLFALRTSESCEEIDTASQVEIECALTRAHADLEAAELIIKGDTHRWRRRNDLRSVGSRNCAARRTHGHL